jgi:nucleoside-diphosphate-sugar epimerase
MKILITGSNGFIGKNLCEFYIDKYEVIKIDKSHDIVKSLNIYSPDIIIHCAAEIYNSDLMFDSNILYTKNILDYCKNTKIKKLIMLGSSSEYGYKKEKMEESNQLEPRTIYEATKAACSMLAQGYAASYKIPITLIRPFTIVGRYEKSHKFFPTLYRSWKLNKEIQLSNGVHDFVFIDDFLKSLDSILNYENENFDIINIGSGYQTDNYKIVNIFEDITGYKYKKILVKKLREFDSFNWVASTEKLKNKYKINIVDNIEFYLKNGILNFIHDCEKDKLYV